MLHSNIKAIPRCFLSESYVETPGLGGLDLFGCQQTISVVLGLLLLIFDKLIIILLFYKQLYVGFNFRLSARDGGGRVFP